jgi:hypothetical protein
MLTITHRQLDAALAAADLADDVSVYPTHLRPGLLPGLALGIEADDEAEAFEDAVADLLGTGAAAFLLAVVEFEDAPGGRLVFYPGVTVIS